jgi:hypothetical protein
MMAFPGGAASLPLPLITAPAVDTPGCSASAQLSRIATQAGSLHDALSHDLGFRVVAEGVGQRR